MIPLPFDASIASLGWALAGAFCLGLSKTGFPGLALLNIMIIADCFGAKNSNGIILPLLILCDLMVYPLFRQYSSWSKVWPLMPTTAAGIVGGFLMLRAIDEPTARKWIGLIILVMLSLQFVRNRQRRFLEQLPDGRFFTLLAGLAIGIATMLANAAGPIFSIHALIHKMTKEDFLGIGARFFLLVNLAKVPLLQNLSLITAESLKLDLILIPGTILGILVGKRLIRHVPQKAFDLLLYGFSLVAGLRLLLWS